MEYNITQKEAEKRLRYKVHCHWTKRTYIQLNVRNHQNNHRKLQYPDSKSNSFKHSIYVQKFIQRKTTTKHKRDTLRTQYHITEVTTTTESLVIRE